MMSIHYFYNFYFYTFLVLHIKKKVYCQILVFMNQFKIINTITIHNRRIVFQNYLIKYYMRHIEINDLVKIQ